MPISYPKVTSPDITKPAPLSEKGGMGEVYRVLDDRLTHDVAIRASNSQFMGSFTREARTIASPKTRRHSATSSTWPLLPD